MVTLTELTLREEIGRGVSGVVYAADSFRESENEATDDPHYVIKQGGYQTLLPEIDLLSQVHGNALVTMHDFDLELDDSRLQVDEDDPVVFPIKATMVLDRGIPLKAYKGALDRNRLIGCVLGVTQACRSIGLVHCDIKPDNMVVVEDRVVLIDFGLSLWELHGWFFGLAYTGSYRDPNYLPGAWNSVANETFAVGKTIAAMMNGHRWIPSNLPFVTGDPTIDRLLREALEPDLDRRDSLATLHRRFGNVLGSHEYTLERRLSPTITKANADPEIPMWKTLVRWLLEIAVVENLSLRVAFTVLTNMHRTLGLYVGKDAKSTRPSLRMFGVAHLLLADYSLAGERRLDLNQVLVATRRKSDLGVSKESRRNALLDLGRLVIDLVKMMGGTLSPITIWDRLVRLRRSHVTIHETMECFRRACRWDYVDPADEEELRQWMVDLSVTDPVELPLDCRYSTFQSSFSLDLLITGASPSLPIPGRAEYRVAFSRPAPTQILERYVEYCREHPAVINSYDELGMIWGFRSLIDQHPKVANEIFARMLQIDRDGGRVVWLDAFDVLWGNKLASLRRLISPDQANLLRSFEGNSWTLSPTSIAKAVRSNGDKDSSKIKKIFRLLG